MFLKCICIVFIIFGFHFSQVSKIVIIERIILNVMAHMIK